MIVVKVRGKVQAAVAVMRFSVNYQTFSLELAHYLVRQYIKSFSTSIGAWRLLHVAFANRTIKYYSRHMSSSSETSSPRLLQMPIADRMT